MFVLSWQGSKGGHKLVNDDELHALVWNTCTWKFLATYWVGLDLSVQHRWLQAFQTTKSAAIDWEWNLKWMRCSW